MKEINVHRNEIKALLEKYWLAETTLEEEKALADYFRGGDVDAEWLRYASFFEYIGEEKMVSPSAGFEERILARVGLGAEDGMGTAREQGAERIVPEALVERIVPEALTERIVSEPGGKVSVPASVRNLNFGYAAAAAVLFCVCSLFIVVSLSRGRGGETIEAAPTGVNTMAWEAKQGTTAAAIKDTYDDPEKALAAVKRALLVASVHMNEGKMITQKNMDRLGSSWAAATGN
jgi:hypothetical protein